MKRLLTMFLSMTLLFSGIGEVPVYAASAENQPVEAAQEALISSPAQETQLTEEAESVDEESMPETEIIPDADVTDDDSVAGDDELPVEEPGLSDELLLSEEAEEADEADDERLMATYSISGDVNASDLEENGYYTLTGDTTITISEGDNIEIGGISNDPLGAGVNLTIQGDTAGILKAEYIELSSTDQSKTLKITGGTVECENKIKNDGKIIISGGNISASTIYSKSDIEIHNSTVKVENLSDSAHDGCIKSNNGDIIIDNSKVTATCNASAAIYAGNNLTITKGAVNAQNIGGTNAYGLWSVAGVVTIQDPLLDARGGIAAIRSGGTIGHYQDTAIVYPTGGTFGYGSDSHFYTVLDSDNLTAKEVHIESGNSFNEYDISADQTELDFGTSDYGVTPPEARTIVITNNGNTAIRLDEIDTSTATAFTITPLSDTYLLSGETATFTVRPKENLTAGEEFDQQIGVYTNRSDIFISPITLKFKINAFQYKLTPETSEVDFGSFKEENYSDEEQTIWLQNDSSVTNGTLHLKSEDLENYYGLQKFTLESDGNQITKGNRINLTIRPHYDLEPGVHTETLVIDTVEGAKATINLKIEVVAWDYTITADKTTLDFGRANIGYTTAPEAQDIVITNVGEKAITLCDPATFSSRYELSLKSGSLALGVGETLTLSVRPKVGLSGGNETIKIKTVQGSEVSVEVKFKVGHYLKGNVNASDLIDNEYYYVIGDTTINIAPGDDKKLRGIWGEQTTDEYNLIIQGSNAGKLSIEGPVYGSHDDSAKTLTIQGGTLDCAFIQAGGNIDISGGDVTAQYIRSKSGNVTLSGGAVKTERFEDGYSITGKDIVISGGYISASCKTRASIYATNDLTVTGGVIKAKSSEGESSYGLQAYDDLSIEGDAYIIAEGAKEAILGDPVSIAEGFQMRSGSNDVHISDSSSHWGHLVTETDELVKSVTIGKDILGESSGEFNKENFDFGTVVIGGEAVEAQAVLIRNTGSIPLVIESISTENYIVEDLSSSIIGVGGTVTFKIRPDLEKSKFSTAGEKTETITVKFSDIEMEITAKIRMVEAAPAIAAAPALLDFGTVPKGYTGLFDTKTVVVTNTGNIAVTLNEPAITGTVFDMGVLSGSHLAPGESAELTISVKDDTAATAGEHTGTLTITGEHSVTSSVSLKLVVEDVGDNIWIEDIPDQDYVGVAVKPEVNVYFGSRKLTDQDYSVSYKNNVNAAGKDDGTAPTVVVKGKGNYAGTASKTFTIKPLDISHADASDLLYAYNSKKAQFGKTKVTYDLGGRMVTLKENTDFTYEWEAEKDYKTAGTYTTTIKGKGNYSGTKTFHEVIAGDDKTLISKVSVSKIPDQPYQGKKIILYGTPGSDETRAVDKKGDPYDLVIKNGSTPLNYGSDYTLSYTENLEIGTAAVTITGNDNYIGSRTVTFKITGTALSKAKTEDFVDSLSYTGSARKQPMKFYVMKKNSEGVSYKDYLTENVDYRADYTDNTEIGTAAVTYTGIGAYTGTVKKTYKITGTAMKDVTIPKDFTATTGKFVYTSYMSEDCYDEHSGSFIYTGGAFEVAGPADAASERPNNGVQLIRYDKTTDTNIDYKNGVDYTVTYKNNILPGTATVTFTGKGRLTGSVSRTFKIVPYNISKDCGSRTTTATIPEPGSYTYTKGGVKPEPVVTCKCFDPVTNSWKEVTLTGEAYTLTYSGKTDEITGTAKPAVTVKGKGAFTGSMAPLEYTITTATLESDAKMSVTDVVYQNKAGICKPVLTVTDKTTGAVLKAGTDYEKTVKYTYAEARDVTVKGKTTLEHRNVDDEVGAKDIVPAGTKIMATVTGMKKYIGSDPADPSKLSATFRFIDPIYDLSKMKITILPQTFTGEKITLTGEDVVFDTEGTDPVFGTDYEILYDDASGYTDKGSYKVIIKAKPDRPFGNSKTVSFNITARSMDYTIHYDGNGDAMAQKLLDKNVDPGKDLTWYKGNYRVTSMKDSVTTKGGKLPKNTIAVQKKTIKNGKETWTNVPATVIAFDKWTQNPGGGAAFENQGIFHPSWLTVFTYGNNIILYAQWK